MDAKVREDDGKDPVGEALGSGDAARHVALVTGMSADAAKTYAAFHSGRWALDGQNKRAA